MGGAAAGQDEKVAVLAQLIPDTVHGYSRISFVTEGEAIFNFAIEHGLSCGVTEVFYSCISFGLSLKLTQSSGWQRCHYC